MKRAGITHSEFVEGYKSGKLQAHVDRSLALRLMDTTAVAKRYRAAHMFWSWIWLLSFPAAVVLFVWVKWWAGLLALLFVSILFKAVRESACQNVLEQALEDEDFYRYAVDLGALKISAS